MHRGLKKPLNSLNDKTEFPWTLSRPDRSCAISPGRPKDLRGMSEGEMRRIVMNS